MMVSAGRVFSSFLLAALLPSSALCQELPWGRGVELTATVTIENRGSVPFVLDTAFHVHLPPTARRIAPGATITFDSHSPPGHESQVSEIRGSAMYRENDGVSSFDPHELSLTWGMGGEKQTPFCHMQASAGLEGGCAARRNLTDTPDVAYMQFFVYNAIAVPKGFAFVAPDSGSGSGSSGSGSVKKAEPCPNACLGMSGDITKSECTDCKCAGCAPALFSTNCGGSSPQSCGGIQLPASVLLKKGGSGRVAGGAAGFKPESCEELKQGAAAADASKRSSGTAAVAPLPPTSFAIVSGADVNPGAVVSSTANSIIIGDLPDGLYAIYPPHAAGDSVASDQSHFTLGGMAIHCTGMSSGHVPAALNYLPLVNTGGTSNMAAWMEADHTTVVHYARVRIDLATRRVHTGDMGSGPSGAWVSTTLTSLDSPGSGGGASSGGASAAGMPPSQAPAPSIVVYSQAEAHQRGLPLDTVFSPFGTARSCISMTSHSAAAAVDLRGTRFAVDPAQFTDEGSKFSKFTVEDTDGEQVARLMGGGYCGWVKSKLNPAGEPKGGWNLQLKGAKLHTVPKGKHVRPALKSRKLF